MLQNSANQPYQPSVSLVKIADDFGEHHALAVGLMCGHLHKTGNSIAMMTNDRGDYVLPASDYNLYRSWAEAALPECKSCRGTGINFPCTEPNGGETGTRCACSNNGQ